jgi:phage tail tape-measure protein
MTDEQMIEQKTVTTDDTDQPKTTETTTVSGAKPHGDEEAGGALTGAVAGAAVGAVAGGPVGAVVGGAIGATSGATAGAIDEKAKDEVVVTHEERPL